MAYIDNEIINKIRDSVNIVDVISSYLPLESRGKNFFGVCPFHDDHSPSMSVSEEKQYYRCFSCGAGGNVFLFVQDYENVSFLEAVSIVAKIGNINFDYANDKRAPVSHSSDNKLFDTATKYYQNNINSTHGLKAKEYLNNRKLDDKIIEEFKIGLSLNNNSGLTNLLLNKEHKINDLVDLGITTNIDSKTDIFINRIMFPIWDVNGNTVGFSGRIYNNEESSKYINSKASRIFKKSEILYNYHKAKPEARKHKKVIVVEGFMDVIRLWSIGIKNSVALMGTAFTKEQLNYLKQLRCEIVLCLDNDSAGENATLAIGETLLKSDVDFGIVRIHKYKDPDEFIVNYGKEEIERVFSSTISFVDYKISYLKKKYNINDSLELSKLINELIPTIDAIKDEVYKQLIIKRITKEFDIDEKLLNVKAIPSVDKKQEIKPQVVKKKRKLNGYNKVAEELIYLMMSNPKYIKIFEKRLGFFPEVEYRNLVNEIRYYYEQNKTINVADFLTHIQSRDDLLELAKEIMINGDDDISDSEFDNIIDIINNAVHDSRIRKLKDELVNAQNIEEKIEITKKIAELKKGCVKNG